MSIRDKPTCIKSTALPNAIKPKRTRNADLSFLTYDFLFGEYITKQKTMKQIAKENHVAVGTIYNHIHLLGIIPREKGITLKGKHRSRETKDKISAKNIGKTLSLEARQKISIANRGRQRKPSLYGGHTKIHTRGYVMVYVPNHPYATKEGYVFEHILAYEKAHNCYVDRSKYCIHHINGIKTDNRIENLLLMTKQDHMSYHSTLRHQQKREVKNG